MFKVLKYVFIFLFHQHHYNNILYVKHLLLLFNIIEVPPTPTLRGFTFRTQIHPTPCRSTKKPGRITQPMQKQDSQL